MKRILLLGLLLFATNIAQANNIIENQQSGHKEYEAVRIPDGSITIDAIGDEKEWQLSQVIDKFINPWNADANPPTSLRLVHDSQYLYFFYETVDEDIVLVDAYKGESSVGKEDRVELFFSTDEALSLYYGFEIDPLGRVMDYSVNFYRKFNYTWNLKEIKTAGKIHETGYRVEGAIPLSFLKEVSGGKNVIYFGAYRGEFSKDSQGKTVENWQCLTDPDTPQPDFHVPSSFGKLKFNF